MSKLATDKVLIQGLVTIKQGDRVLVKQAPNSWVDAGLKGLVSALIQYGVTGGVNGTWAKDPRMYLGSDTATSTTHGMTVLTTPIGTTPGTLPNSISGEDLTNPSSGTFLTLITALWNAGTISGTVGELALYLKPFTKLAIDSIWVNPSSTDAMVSRLSSADADFSSFAIDTGLTLTVAWTIKAVFA